MIKKPLIAGIMLVVAHTAGAAQGDDTNLQQIYTEAGIQGYAAPGCWLCRKGPGMKLSRRTSDTSWFSVPISTSSSCAGVPACRLRHLATGVTAMRSLICRLTRYLMRSGCQRGVISGHNWPRPTRPRRKKGTGERGRTRRHEARH